MLFWLVSILSRELKVERLGSSHNFLQLLINKIELKVNNFGIRDTIFGMDGKMVAKVIELEATSTGVIARMTEIEGRAKAQFCSRRNDK